MNNGLRGRHNRTGFRTWHFTVDDHSIYQTSRLTKPESMLITKARETGRP